MCVCACVFIVVAAIITESLSFRFPYSIRLEPCAMQIFIRSTSIEILIVFTYAQTRNEIKRSICHFSFVLLWLFLCTKESRKNNYAKIESINIGLVCVHRSAPHSGGVEVL